MFDYDVSFHPILRGALVPVAFTGILRSHHSRVVNIELSDENGPYFISLITDRQDWTELSVIVGSDDFRTAVRVPEGTSLRCRFESPHEVSTGSIDTDIPIRDLIEALSRVIPVLSPTDRRTGLMPLVSTGDAEEDAFLRRARIVVTDALNGSRPCDLSPLVGLGIGFTPSGDDFVSGVLLVQQITGLAVVQAPPIRTALGKTTTGGATLLRLALAGFPPEYMSRIVTALLRGAPEEALAIARAHGHSSGLDALTGLLWGISAATTSI